MQVVDNFRAKTIEEFATNYIEKGSKLITDGFKSYKSQKITKDYFVEYDMVSAESAQNQKTELLVFLDHPNVEMTNNLAERTVKPFVINRKNFLFSDTEKGAEAIAAAMSIIETAKRNGLDIYGYLLFLLNTLPELGSDLSDEQLESVMP